MDTYDSVITQEFSSLLTLNPIQDFWMVVHILEKEHIQYLIERGEMVNLEQMQAITTWAKQKEVDIGVTWSQVSTHL